MITTGSNNHPCKCDWPICCIVWDAVVSDVYNDRVLIHRYYDCIMHGTFTARVEVMAAGYLRYDGSLTEHVMRSPCHTVSSSGDTRINNRLRELL